MKRQRSQSCEANEIDDAIFERTQSEHPIDNQNSIFTMIVNHKLIRDISIIETFKEKDTVSMHKKHIVNYVIKIKTDYFDYTIPKRYSEFEKMYQQVENILHVLPKFPPRKFIKPNSKKNIAERREMLDFILKHILKNLNNQMHCFLSFLNIQQQFVKGGFGLNVRIHELSKDELGLNELRDSTKLTASNDQERMVFHYINKLNERYDERKKWKNIFLAKLNFQVHKFLDFYLLEMIQTKKEFCNFLEIQIKIFNHIFHVQVECNFQENFQNLIIIHMPIIIQEYLVKLVQKHQNNLIFLHIYVDTLTIVYKFIKVNELKSDIINFLLDEQEAIVEFKMFQEQAQQKKEEAFQLVIDSSETIHRDNIPTKSNSGEQACILEQEPSLEQLFQIKKNPNLSWKICQEFQQHSIYHIQGQIIKTIHPLNCNLNQALDILTTQKQKWLPTFIQRQVIKQIDKNISVVGEIYLWQEKQLYKKVAFFTQQTLIIEDSRFELQIIPISDTSEYESILKFDEISCKLQLITGIYENSVTTVTIIQNLFDRTQQLQYTPVLLKEVNYFEKAVQQLNSLATQ